MFKNYFITAIRNIKRHKAFSIINMMGLAVGMAVCIMIMMHVQSELSFDDFHKGSDRIYRIYSNSKFYSFGWKLGNTCPYTFADKLKNNYSEIETATYLENNRWVDRVLLKLDDKAFYEDGHINAGPSFFDMFAFPVIYGDLRTALDDPRSLIITEEIARKYFGNENPVGRSVQMEVGNQGNELRKITAVLKDLPHNSNIQFKLLTPVKITRRNEGNYNYCTYIRLKNNVNPFEFEKKMHDQLSSSMAGGLIQKQYFLQKITNIHFYSPFNEEMSPNGEKANIYLFTSIGILLLLLACINFMNMMTARSSVRNNEIAVRQTLGSGKNNIITQFLVESILISFLSLIIALIIIMLVHPIFNRITGADIGSSMLFRPQFIVGFIFLAFITGILAGGYPAFYLSSLKPVAVFNRKGVRAQTRSAFSLRKGLIVFQFIICSLLIAGTILIEKQLHYINTKDLGYQKENILLLPIADYRIFDKYKTLKEELLKYPFVESASLSTEKPSEAVQQKNYFWETPSNDQMFKALSADPDFFKTYGIKLIEGTTFHQTGDENTEEQFILNREAVKYMKLKNTIGTKIGRGSNYQGSVVGVVDDFHFENVHYKITPLIISYAPGSSYSLLSIKLKNSNITDDMELIKTKYKEIIPDKPFDYSFFNEFFDKTYKKDIRFSEEINVFSLLSIFVACLGLLGLVIFAVEKRRKEIGIRKILGAGTKNIMLLVSREFIILIAVANVITVPLAYYAMNLWLKNFAYKTEISWWIFPVAMLVSLFISAVTISYQILKAATANPVQSIRYE